MEESKNNKNVQPKENETYFCSESTDKSSRIEVDLVTSRQKGKEERYLNIKISTKAEIDGNVEEADLSYDISNEQEFKKVKSFFAGLTWND